MKNSVSSILSTILSGFSNVVVQLLAASILGVSEYAQFALAASTVLFILGLGRSAIGQTDIIRGNRGHDRTFAGAAFVFAGSLALIGCTGLAIGLYTNSTSILIVAVAIGVTPLFVLQDSARFRSFRIAQAQWALVSDIVVLVLTIGFFYLLSKDQYSADLMVLVWGLASGAGLLVIIRPLGYWGGWNDTVSWWHNDRDIVIPGAIEYLLQSAVPFLLNWVILVIGGAQALAGYRIVQLVFASLGNLAQGLNAIEMPSISDSPTRQNIRHVLGRNAFLLVTSGLLLTASMLILPDDFGVALFGDSWQGVAAFLAAGAVHGTLNALLIPNYQLLRLLGEAAYSVKVRTVTVILTPIASLLLGWTHGAIGIAWALASVTLIGYAARLHKVITRTSSLDNLAT